MRLIILLTMYFQFQFSFLNGQNFSLLFDNETSRNERGTIVQEYQEDFLVVSSFVCLSNNYECCLMQRFTKEGLPLWKAQIEWMDKANWETFFTSNDTIVIAGHANGSTMLFGRSLLLHRRTIQGDSLDTFEYPIEIYGYSNANSFGVIEYNNEYYIFGDARRISDQHVLGLILRISKTGELLQQYEYEGGLSSNVYDLQAHPSLGLVFIDQEGNGAGAGNPQYRRIIQFIPDSIEPFKIIYTVDFRGDTHLTTLEILNDETMVFLDNLEGGITIRNGLRYISSEGILLYNFEYDNFLFEFNFDWPIFFTTSLNKTLNNDLIVSGSGQFNYDPAPRINHGYLMKVSEEGEFLWQRYFVRYDGGDLPVNSWLFDAKEMSDGSILATGYEEVARNGELEWDMWLLKLDENGCLDSENCDSEQFTTSVIDLTSNQNNVLSLYPNPTQNTLHLSTDLPLQHYSISSLSGRVLKKRSYESTIDISTLVPGSYLITVWDHEGNSMTERFVKLE